jgi:hypothetical protein
MRSIAGLLELHQEWLESHSWDHAYDYALENGLDTSYSKLEYVTPYYDGYSLTFTCVGAGAAILMRDLRRQIGGKWEKEGNDYNFSLTRKYQEVNVCIQANRESVCEKVLTGTKTVEHAAVEAQEAREAYTEEVDVYEWQCSSLLAED